MAEVLSPSGFLPLLLLLGLGHGLIGLGGTALAITKGYDRNRWLWLGPLLGTAGLIRAWQLPDRRP
jgi:hypothetical protein